MKHEYHEGPVALDRFKRGMTTLFQAKKESVKEKPTPKRKQGKASKG
jgi:hypothetical protein